MINPKDVKLGAVVSLTSWKEAYNHSTIKNVEDGYVHLFRPYVHTADFSYAGGIICYVGIEEYKVPITIFCETYDLIRKAPKLR